MDVWILASTHEVIMALFEQMDDFIQRMLHAFDEEDEAMGASLNMSPVDN